MAPPGSRKIRRIRLDASVSPTSRRVLTLPSSSSAFSSSAVLISRLATGRPPFRHVWEHDKLCSNSRLKRFFLEGSKTMDRTGRIAIGRLAKHTATNIETIRYYERVGLWPAPARSAGGYRLYGTEHLKRLNFIRRARTLGFSIGEVRTLLRLADERKRPCAEGRVGAEAHLADVRTKIADLKVMDRGVRETVARCADGPGSPCLLLHA